MTPSQRIKKAKLLLRGKEPDEALLSLYFDLMDQKVKNYCHREDIPEGLELIIVEMVVDYYHKVGSSSELTGAGAISSIKRGDTSIQYSVNTNTENYNEIIGSGGADFFKNWKRQLNAYRKLVSR